MSEIKIGDYAIVRGAYRWDLIEVASKTSRQFKGRAAGYSGYVRTIRAEDCVYCGGEEKARLLHERLTSSDNLCDDERRKSFERRDKRNAELLAAAKGAK